jgi:hypothetical protein
MSTASHTKYADHTVRTRSARVSAVDRLEYFLRSRGAKVVVLALVANTLVAQLCSTTRQASWWWAAQCCLAT